MVTPAIPTLTKPARAQRTAGPFPTAKSSSAAKCFPVGLQVSAIGVRTAPSVLPYLPARPRFPDERAAFQHPRELRASCEKVRSSRQRNRLIPRPAFARSWKQSNLPPDFRLRPSLEIHPSRQATVWWLSLRSWTTPRSRQRFQPRRTRNSRTNWCRSGWEWPAHFFRPCEPGMHRPPRTACAWPWVVPPG